MFILPGITAVNKEQLRDTEAAISCRVTGLTKKLDDVIWRTSSGSPITSGEDGYIIQHGAFESGFQATILTVPNVKNTQDSTYMCLISSEEWAIKDKSTTVTLEVFSK